MNSIYTRRKGERMEANEFVKLALERIQESVDRATNGLTEEELKWQPNPEANPIGFILWHQIRAEDGIVNGMIRQQPQVWMTGKWYEKCNMSDDPQNSGGGYTPEQIATFKPPKLEVLQEYAKAVRAQINEYLDSLTPDKFNDVIETPFGKFTVVQILTLLLSELAQHTGHIGYIRGLKRGFNK